MKKFVAFCVANLLMIASAQALSFVDDHNRLFKNQQICAPDMQEEVQAEAGFKKMFARIVRDEEGKDLAIEILDYSAYSTVIRNHFTGQECSIVRHDGCYSAFCN